MDNITRPTLLLNETICKHNIERMATKARRNGIRFRPHFKTHQSGPVGNWFRDYGVEAITVSSVSMAQYFAQHGWQDITVAFPVNWREIDTINDLAGLIKLGLLVESLETVAFLKDRLTHPVSIWVEIDAGYHRSGISWDQTPAAQAICDAVRESDHLHLAGFLTHSGNSYGQDVETTYHETVTRMTTLRDQIDPVLLISIGDTPTCSIMDDLSEVDEIRPGNFVFYDVMQVYIGSCTLDDIAVAVACPVVAKHEAHNQLIVYGGGVHLSKDSIIDPDGNTSFGLVARLSEDGWGEVLPDVYVKSLSQEHGIIHMDAATMQTIQRGDLLAILPVHSCMTADLLKHYRTLTGEMLTMAPIPAGK